MQSVHYNDYYIFLIKDYFVLLGIKYSFSFCGICCYCWFFKMMKLMKIIDCLDGRNKIKSHLETAVLAIKRHLM